MVRASTRLIIQRSRVRLPAGALPGSLCRGSTMTATNHDDQLGEILFSDVKVNLTVHLAIVFHVFIAVAVMVIVCGRRGIGP